MIGLMHNRNKDEKMNTIFCSVLVLLVLKFGTYPCRGEEPIKTKQSTLINMPSALLKTGGMSELLNRKLNAVKVAEREIAEFQEEVEGGKIKIDYRWCAYSGEKDKKLVRLAKYASQNGPMEYFTKRVYSDSNFSNEVHTLGCDIYFHTNGLIKAYLRRDWAEEVQYFEDGRIKSFHVQKSDGQYIARWDTNGCLVQEGTSKGLIEKKNGNGEIK